MIKKLLNLIQRYWLPLTALLIITITTASLYPITHLPPVPGTDKTHHFIAYAALIFPMALAKPRYWGYLFLAMLGFGGTIEFIQPYVNRYGEWLDMAANSSGLLCGWLMAQAMRVMFLKPTATDQS